MLYTLLGEIYAFHYKTLMYECIYCECIIIRQNLTKILIENDYFISHLFICSNQADLVQQLFQHFQSVSTL